MIAKQRVQDRKLLVGVAAHNLTSADIRTSFPA